MFKRYYDEAASETTAEIRKGEVEALDHSINLMKAADKVGCESREAIEAMFFTSRLWGVFLEDLASSENPLPKELKAKIISIGIWALKYVESMRRGNKKNFQPLIEVSAIILEGFASTAMKIHLKRNEKLFINGAVIMLDRRGTVELLNDAQFLMQNHVMQQEDAKRPLEQVYFIVQSMLMDPSKAPLTYPSFKAFLERLKSGAKSMHYRDRLNEVEALVGLQDYFEALKLLRRSFTLDDFDRPAATVTQQTGVAA